MGKRQCSLQLNSFKLNMTFDLFYMLKGGVIFNSEIFTMGMFNKEGSSNYNSVKQFFFESIKNILLFCGQSTF